MSTPRYDFIRGIRQRLLRMVIILWFAFILLAGTYICAPIQDPDLWWHITSGRWMLSHAQVPYADQWGMFSAGRPWRAYSWSNELVYALVERHWGIHGLLTLKIILAILFSFSLFYCLGRMSKSWFVGALLGLYAASACFNHFTLRPQVTVWICFIWILYLAQRVFEDPVFKRPAKAAIMLTMMIWANSHLSAALGLAAVFLWLWFSRPGGNRCAYTAAGYAFLGSLFTPYLGGEWLTLFHKTSHPFLFNAIIEFQPANILQYSTVFLFVLSGLALTLVHFRPRLVSLPALLGFGAFVIGALAVVKFLPFAVIYTAALIARMWSAERWPTAAFGGLGGAVEEFGKLYKKFEGQGLAFLVLILAALNVLQVWQAPLDATVTPVAAVDFIKDNGLPGPIMNPFGQGGYLLYRFSDARGDPEMQVAIDGRTNLITEDHWKKYMAALKGMPDWKGYLNIVQPKTVLWRNDSPLVSILIADGNWCQVQRNGSAERGYTVFLRKDLWQAQKLESSNCA